MRMRLEKRYRIRSKGYDVVFEELKQDLSAISQKMKRYSERVKQYNQNSTLCQQPDTVPSGPSREW